LPGKAEALTIALALLQKGLFRLAGTDGTRIGGTQSPCGKGACSPPTTPPHRWELVCSHRGCDMCRSLQPLLRRNQAPGDGERRSIAGLVALPCEGRAGFQNWRGPREGLKVLSVRPTGGPQGSKKSEGPEDLAGVAPGVLEAVLDGGGAATLGAGRCHPERCIRRLAGLFDVVA